MLGPPCINYAGLRLKKTNAGVSASVCYGEDNKSTTGWSLSVDIFTVLRGDLAVREDIDKTTLETIKRMWAEHIGESRVRLVICCNRGQRKETD